MKVALVHYWLVNMRGGERVLEEMCELYPQADIFTHVVDPNRISAKLASHKITTTFISRLPMARKLYKAYLPFTPLALEALDLRGYDLVISSESGPAKGVITHPDTMHVCYCHSPMRYIWNMYHEYMEESGALTRLIALPAFHYLRGWDYASAARVDYFVANSRAVASRIRKYYRRESEVIAPPVATELFRPSLVPPTHYLFCSQLVGYKRCDHVIEAFNRMKKPLVVIGAGTEFDKLKAMAGPTIQMLGSQPLSALQAHYANCRALIFPAEEDFGIVPVEAMAAGRPIIAYGRGGALDTVVDGVTGVLYQPQTVDGLMAAVERFEAMEAAFKPENLIAHAQQFSRIVFRTKFADFVERKYSEWQCR